MQKTLKKTQKGFTLIELLIVIAVIAILAAIAIPNLLSSRKAANESSAISSVRTLITAQETYRSRLGTYGTSANLVGQSLIDTTLNKTQAEGGKSGYYFTVTPDATSPKTAYIIEAEPVDTNSGTRSFFADQTGVIRAHAAQTVPADGTTGTPIE